MPKPQGLELQEVKPRGEGKPGFTVIAGNLNSPPSSGSRSAGPAVTQEICKVMKELSKQPPGPNQLPAKISPKDGGAHLFPKCLRNIRPGLPYPASSNKLN